MEKFKRSSSVESFEDLIDYENYSLINGNLAYIFVVSNELRVGEAE